MDLEKNKQLISIAIKYMNEIQDPEHDINHMIDVVNYTMELLQILNVKCNKEACIIGAYFHDVGRTIKNEGHEELSCQILQKEMKILNYNQDFINICINAIKYHNWKMKPTTIEGLIVKDADKLGFIGINRWKSAQKNNYDLTEIKKLLPRLRNEFLYFEESKKIYDRDIKKIQEML